MEDMRNIVVLKDLPSNLVEEAIIVLKQNQKIKKPEYVENKGKTEQKSEKHKFGNYITKEAEMLITDYITKVEKNKKNKEIKNLEKATGYQNYNQRNYDNLDDFYVNKPIENLN